MFPGNSSSLAAVTTILLGAMRGPNRLHCDAVDPREGRGWGKPCPRRVVVESFREMADPALSYTMHFCERHRKRADETPRVVIRNRVREVAR